MLNPFLYYLKNKNKGSLLLFAIVVCVLGVTFISTIILSISETCKPLSVYPYEYFTAVLRKDNSDEDADKKLDEKLKSYDCYKVNISVFDFKLITVSSSSMILNLDEDTDITTILYKCELKLVDGSLPQKGKNEIVVHESILKNQKLKIGDKLKSFKITGAFSGKPVMGFGYMNKSDFETAFKQRKSYIVFGNAEAISELDSLSNDEWKVYDIDDAKKDLDDSFSDLNVILAISIIMLTISISISIASLVCSQYASRYDEFAILNAIGYKKKSVISMIIKEIVIISGIGWIIGYGLALLGVWLVYVYVYKDSGQTISIYNSEALMYSFVPLICSIVFTVLPTTRKLIKTDLVSIIERRN